LKLVLGKFITIEIAFFQAVMNGTFIAVSKKLFVKSGDKFPNPVKKAGNQANDNPVFAIECSDAREYGT